METRGHGQTVGDRLGLIDPARARSADVQFLQADNVRLELGDDGDDPADIQTAIRADTAVDIVGKKARHEVAAV